MFESKNKGDENKREHLQHQFKMHKGHTIYEIDKNTFEIGEAEMEYTDKTSKDAAGMVVRHKKIVMKKTHYYISALNKKNAFKRLRKLGIKIPEGV